MKEVTWNNLQKEWRTACVKKKHPMRLMYLASISGSGSPRQRTVILRNVTDPCLLWFYTDLRSPKVIEIKNTPEVSALFYHPKKQLQVVVYGKAQLLEDPDQKQRLWESIPSFAHKDYQGLLTAGEYLEEDETPSGGVIDPTLGSENFQPVFIVPEQVDVLQLERGGHRRYSFEKGGEGEWKRFRIQA